jgi:hypothetical protein
VRDGAALKRAMASAAIYRMQGRRPSDYAGTVWRARVSTLGALKSLGRSASATWWAPPCMPGGAIGLRKAFEVLNEVVLNQVLVSFGDPEKTRRAIAALQADGTCFCGGTEWQGRTAMRISVSSWATTEADVDRSVQAMIRAAGRNAA